jgi:NADPH-dependent curcumin reductase CurA
VSDFDQRVLPAPILERGEALLRIKLINVHSGTRARITGGQIKPGQTDRENFACGQVVASKDAVFPIGAIVACQSGWQEYQVIRSADGPVGFAPPSEQVKALNQTGSPWTYVFRNALSERWSPSVLLEIFGTSGMTAWFGLRQYGPLSASATVAVAAATGGVGSIVGQLAKAAGCRTVGFAGGEQRCKWVCDQLGLDDCLDYTRADFGEQLRDAFSGGIDVFSDGVGGKLTEQVVQLMNRRGRLLSYGSAAAAYGEGAIDGASSTRTLRERFGLTQRVESILSERQIMSAVWTVDRFYHQRLRAEDHLSRLLSAGLLRPHAHTALGFERIPSAITQHYKERGFGKLQVALE